MATASPAQATFHQPKHVHLEEDAEPDLDRLDHPHSSHRRRSMTKLPVIPDLRFEYSYVRSVQPYVRVERVPAETGQALLESDAHEGYEKVDHEAEDGKQQTEEAGVKISKQQEIEKRSLPSEVITVQWKNVAWVTLKDQVISPLLQGALWALASYYFRPLSVELGSRVGTLVHGTLPKKEGSAVSWLRGWAKSIGLSGLTSSNGNSNNIQRTSK